jgi:hypothetical protein
LHRAEDPTDFEVKGKTTIFIKVEKVRLEARATCTEDVNSTTDKTRYPYNAPRDALRPVSMGW